METDDGEKNVGGEGVAFADGFITIDVTFIEDSKVDEGVVEDGAI